MADELLRCDIGRLDGGPNEAAPRLLVMKMPLHGLELEWSCSWRSIAAMAVALVPT